MRTIEATIDEEGKVHLAEPVTVPTARRALVTILDEDPAVYPNETAMLSEESLAKDWNRPEEDVAWAHLQKVPSFWFHSPFSDLSRAELRPALVVASVGHRDLMLAQITSKLYADPRAMEVTDRDFRSGSLRVTCYVRPGKLFTAHRSLIKGEVGKLTPEAFGRIVQSVVAIFNASIAS
jgi:mRNA interferase MazF